MATAGVPLWSTTAATNSTADPAVNWAEGQAPSSVNDSARAMMASVAKWRDDVSGSTTGLTTGGSSTAFTVTTNSTFATAAAMSGVIFTIIPHATSGAAPTLAVDGLTARNINIATGVNVMTGALILGTPYLVKYVHASTEFILVNSPGVSASTILGNPTASAANVKPITLGGGLAFSGSTLAVGGLVPPQGRLTLTSATPILVTDASAQSTVYYTPYIGNLVPIYDGSNFIATAFSELSMVMSGANFAASAIYDLFVVNDSSTVRLGIGPVWGTLTAGSGARGTGAGTTELQRLNGILTNKVTMTLRYSASSTVSVAANQATYVGSIFMDGTNSQVSCHASYGQSRKWGLWNAYNRMPLFLQAGDGTASWSYTTASYRPSNNSTANSLSVFVGLAEEAVKTDFIQRQTVIATSSAIVAQSSVGWNSTTAASGTVGYSDFLVGAAANGINANVTTAANYILVPPIGVHVVTALEYGAVTTTFYGTQTHMKLLAQWKG